MNKVKTGKVELRLARSRDVRRSQLIASTPAPVWSVEGHRHRESQNIPDRLVSTPGNNSLVFCLLQGRPHPDSTSVNKETLPATTFQSGFQEPDKLTDT